MNYSIRHCNGGSDDGPPMEALEELYGELKASDAEHGDVSVTNDDTGWCLSAHRDGRVVLEHLGDEGGPMHMIPVSREKVLVLWHQLIAGELEAVLANEWRPGYTS